MKRVMYPQKNSNMAGLYQLQTHGLPERVWIINQGELRELFFDFTNMPKESNLFKVPKIDESLMTIGLFRSQIRLAGINAPNLRVAIGTLTGRLWLEADEEWVLINWSIVSFEKCFERRTKFYSIGKRQNLNSNKIEFNTLVEDIIQIEPQIMVPNMHTLYWHKHLEGIAEDFGLFKFPFPWKNM